MAQTLTRDEAIRNLVDAMVWLLDDLRDAGEDANPETGEMYDSVECATEALRLYREASDGK